MVRKATEHGKQSIRLADIAKETGYSLATVSKALNGRADVSEATRQTINAVLKKYGYSRKATTGKKQKLIEIVFQDFDNVWALEVMRGAIREAKLHDLSVHFSSVCRKFSFNRSLSRIKAIFSSCHRCSFSSHAFAFSCNIRRLTSIPFLPIRVER